MAIDFLSPTKALIALVSAPSDHPEGRYNTLKVVVQKKFQSIHNLPTGVG